MKTRFIKVIGTRISLRVYEMVKDGNLCPHKDGAGYSAHEARVLVADTPIIDDIAGGTPSDYPEHQWPKVCPHCGYVFTDKAIRQILREDLYDTPSGKPEPGDMYFKEVHKPDEKCWSAGWENCDGKHLIAVLPTGHEWDMDSRASNCTMKEDKTHRCWVRHGEPPNITVDKCGHTCQAGAGSILSYDGKYHGFLRNGEFTNC